MEQQTIVKKFYELRDSNELALITYNDNGTVSKKYTWQNYYHQSLKFANNLTKYNYFSPEAREKNNKNPNIAIHAFNSPEWFISAMGTMITGKYFCGIYNTNKNEQCMHIINTGECGTLIVESIKQFNESYNKKEIIDELIHNNIRIIVIDSSDRAENLAGLNIIYWNDLDLESDLMELFAFPKINLSDICTLIFTSGTTGNPKAVEITHQNIITTVNGVIERFSLNMFQESVVSYLPLSHIAGQLIDLYCPIFIGAQVHFARPDALKGSLKDTLKIVRPSIFFGVPRVWEKFKEAMIKVGEKKYVGRSGQILKHTMNIVKFIEYQYRVSESYYYQTALWPLSVVSSQITNLIKQQLGLDRCKHFATGAAPISKEVLEYFTSIGIQILELYGMSETCGVICLSDPLNSLKGSCGKALNGVEIKIGDHQEILCRGMNIFKGYHTIEGSEDKIDSGIDSDGFLHTGDCGKLDDNGYLYITGRIKELIITAGGENIPPVLIEDKIKHLIQSDTHLSVEVVLIGDKRKYLTMLIFSPDEQINDQVINKFIKEYNFIHAISNAQRVQKFKIIRDILTVDNQMITPTMKLKRSKIYEKYLPVIESMYDGVD
jgi:long-chain-fatty-acid--CoA ligase ACSBG